VKRRDLVVGAALAAAAVVGLDVLGDATQTRPDREHPNAVTEVVFDVSVRDERNVAQAAQGLWGACQTTIQRSTSPADVAVEGSRARVVVRPALGTHARQRLSGCLEDATLDRVLGRVVAMRLHDAS
jgi:hypothetical protein